MKKNILNTLLFGASALVLGGLTSCEDYLTIYPTGSITKEDFWNTSNDVEGVRVSAYYQMTQQVGKILQWGEFRSDNVTLNKADQWDYRYLQDAILQPDKGMFDWSGLYTGINYCNEVLENGQTMIDNDIDPSFTNSDWMPIKAEMVSLRALYYFYLVRAFRDVPYVTHSVSTDTEAKAARIAVTPGYEILEKLIADVEEVQTKAAKNYGNAADNKGRFTIYSMSALLADMYLWRAALLKGIENKKDASGLAYPYAGDANSEVVACLTKCLENCDVVINYQKSEYKKELDRLNVPAEDPRRKLEFPLAQSDKDFGSDEGYDAVFGTRNGSESVFELQFDTKNNKNGFYSTYFYSVGSSTGPGIMIANQNLCAGMTKAFNEKGYGKLDYRFLSYLLWEKAGQSTFPIVKNVATRISAESTDNMAEGYRSIPSLRDNSSNNANWPVYRLTDVLLMKSEAIARLSAGGKVENDPRIALGYHMVNAVLRRNLPAADSLNTGSSNYIERLNPNFKDNKSWADQNDRTANDLLVYTMNERQREFLGEGKRWFDIVRECEWRGATEDVLADWMSAKNEVKNRCRSLWSLYNPIYKSEMKINGVGYGDGKGKLVQNPIWQKYMTDK